jgi:hypothetical protein
MHILAALVTLGTLGLVQSPDPSPSKNSQKQDARPQSNRSRSDFPRSMIDDPKKFEAAIPKGRAEAEKQLELNQAKIWTLGLNPDMFSESLDRETGLYLALVPGRKSDDDDILGRLEGHNARIREHIRDHGLPKNSFKPWENELFDLKKYFTDRISIDKPIRLIVGGPEATSPGGKHVVKLVNRLEEGTPYSKPKEATYIQVGKAEVKVSNQVDRLDFVELVWGPVDSWFAVLKYRGLNSDQMDYIAIDLRSVRRIRTEWNVGKEDAVKRPMRIPPDPIPGPSGALQES